jgi:hypothetical protein
MHCNGKQSFFLRPFHDTVRKGTFQQAWQDREDIDVHMANIARRCGLQRF